MREILFATVAVLTITWCIYGFVVFWRWEKVAKKANELLDELAADLEEEVEV